MKKTLTHLVGIVFLIAILVAGACSPARKMEKVEIYCKAYEEEGVLHFEMWDSNNKKGVVTTRTGDTIIAKHITDVMPKTKVTWTWVEDSEIQEFLKIKPKKYGKIIDKDPEKIPDSKKLTLKIPETAKIPSEKEKYIIEFLDGEGNVVPVDPYLRIPDR